MRLPEEFAKEIIAPFIRVLETPPEQGRQKEQEVQDFIEENTHFFYAPIQTHKGIFFRRILSKFPLDTSIVTDLVYVTSQSDCAKVVLVELEDPRKPIFRKEVKRAIFSEKFTSAVSQVKSWRSFINDNKDEVLRRLSPILKPNPVPIYFYYVLVYGRSHEKSFENRKKAFSDMNANEGITVITYDNIIDAFIEGATRTLNVLSLSGEGFRYKYMHFFPEGDFAYLGPDRLFLTAEQKADLKKDGYEIDEWEKGRLLCVNRKYASIEAADRARLDRLKGDHRG